MPGQPQPSQKHFDSLLWQALRLLEPGRAVYVESESKKIGRLQIPDSLIDRMHHHSPVLRVEMPDAARIELLLEDYGYFATDAARFCSLLDGLIELRGRETVGRWQAMARAGAWAEVFGAMMLEHYDPLYLRSIDRHFAGSAQAPEVLLVNGGQAAMHKAARSLLTGDLAR